MFKLCLSIIQNVCVIRNLYTSCSWHARLKLQASVICVIEDNSW
jgi:hypothetical protein